MLRFRKTAAALAGLMLLTSCKSAVTKDVATTHKTTTSTSVSGAHIGTLPLDWVTSHYPIHSYLMGKAEALLTSQCMRNLGFDYGFDRMFNIRPNEYTIADRYVTFSPQQGASIGYTSKVRPNDNREPTFPSDANERREFLLALTGSEDGDTGSSVTVEDPIKGSLLGTLNVPRGCQSKVIVSIYGSFDAYKKYTADDLWVQNLQLASSTEALVSQPVLDMFTSWSKCMSTQGFTFTKPSEAQGNAWPQPRPSTLERKAAAADMRCRISVKYLEIFAQSEVVAQQRAVEKYTTQLNQIRAERYALEKSAILMLSK